MPGKQYTNRFIEEVFENYLGKRRGLCATARAYTLHYQTILKWLHGLASKRETKAICFSRHGPPAALAEVPDREYTRGFWNMLTRSFRDAPGGVLTTAGGLLWKKYECPLF